MAPGYILTIVYAASAVLVCTGCARIDITPGKLAVAPVGFPERVLVLKQWSDAVGLCNEFLASSFRRTLPEGRLWLTNEHMQFIAGNEVLPVRVRCTTSGDLVVGSGTGIAQERSDGFVVGFVEPRRNRLVDNSFFKLPDGKPYSSAIMAQLILHELTHSYYRTGTVGLREGCFYYMEVIFLFRNRNHSAERLPNQTSSEFASFIQAWDKAHASASAPAARELAR